MNSHTRRKSSPAKFLVVGGLIVAVLLVVPRFADAFQTMVLTYGLILAIATLGFNLLLGYTGLLSFGHAAYFGVGAYAVAFMARDLGIVSMELFIVGGLAATGLVTAFFGFICVRHTKAFFTILTLALAQVLWSLTYKFFWVTGGSDGMVVKRPVLLGGFFSYSGTGNFPRFVHDYYYYVLVLFCVCVVFMWWVVHSPFGKALQSIRDNETRAAFVGVEIRRYRWIAFMISGLMVGLSGVLWAPLSGLAKPDVLFFSFSGKLALLTLLGGFRNFTGPIVGAIFYNHISATHALSFLQIPAGVLLIVVIVFLPRGIVGTFLRVVEWARQRRRPEP